MEWLEGEFNRIHEPLETASTDAEKGAAEGAAFRFERTIQGGSE